MDGKVVVNPNAAQREVSKMYVTLAGSEDKIVMIEAGADRVPDDVMLAAIKEGHETIKEICRFINGIVAEIGKPKFEYTHMVLDHDVWEKVKALGYDKMRQAVLAVDKQDRDNAIAALTEEIKAQILEENPDEDTSYMGEAMYKLEKFVVREYLMKEHRRVDGRALDEIRPLSAEVGLLPRVHGSGLFQRGQTQVLTTLTLGTIGEIQKLDGIDLEDSKRYIHHYNMPGYSVGEAKAPRSPGRREIGHGALAERALLPVIPSEEEFPYALRLVSEVLMSNGSTSQGSVCASTLALMDGGVPIKEPVAGISCGLLIDEEDQDKFITFMDIQGIEDFFGDMDFKVAGTKSGITAIQVDIKVQGLSYDIIEQAFAMTKKGREQIIDNVILAAIPAVRDHLSQYAPKIMQMKIDVDKIREVIGSGGKTINKIIAETGVKIDIDDFGNISIAYVDEAAGLRAKEIIRGIIGDLDIGGIFKGKVTRIMPIGAFVEILPGVEGLVHISKLDKKRVGKVEDVCQVGDEMTVKLLEIDDKGRLNLSRKDCLK